MISDILAAIIIASLSAWLGAYLGYRYAFRISEVQNEQKLKLEIKAVSYELEKHATMINTEKEFKVLKEKYFLTGEPFRTDALTHFIASGDYLELNNEKLAEKLISLNQWYERTNNSAERYNNYSYGIGMAMSNKEKIISEIGSAWIGERTIFKQKIEQVVPLLKNRALLNKNRFKQFLLYYINLLRHIKLSKINNAKNSNNSAP